MISVFIQCIALSLPKFVVISSFEASAPLTASVMPAVTLFMDVDEARVEKRGPLDVGLAVDLSPVDGVEAIAVTDGLVVVVVDQVVTDDDDDDDVVVVVV